jgi:hypothetical protein
MKPGPSYKMSRAVKTMLARNWNNKNIGQIRRAAIMGELYSRVIVKAK